MLGGQHLAKALLERRQELLAQHLDPPRWLTVVKATVLKAATPIPVREAAAGDAQYAQSGVRSLPLSGWAELLLGPDVQAEADQDTRLAISIRKAGLNRAMTLVWASPPLRSGGRQQVMDGVTSSGSWMASSQLRADEHPLPPSFACPPPPAL